MKKLSYIDLINRFWDYSRVKRISDIDTTIYFYLLNECNIRRWLNPFELQTRNLEADLRISRKTIGEARNRLKQRGLIDFIEGRGRGPTIYLIDGANVNNELLEHNFCVSPEKHKGNTKVTQGKHKGNTKVTQQENTPIIIEDKEDIKTKDSIVRGSPTPQQESLFAEEEKKTRKKSTQSKSPPPVPTLDEVLAYFLSQDADKRLENWEESARRFYDNFNAVDWRDKFNRRITRWDSRANSWILDDEKRYKEILKHEQPRTNGSSPPSSGIPIRGRVTPACGLKRRDKGGET